MCDDYPLIVGTASIAENCRGIQIRFVLSQFAGHGQSSRSTAISIASRRHSFRRAGAIDIFASSNRVAGGALPERAV